jgi:dihydroorotase
MRCEHANPRHQTSQFTGVKKFLRILSHTENVGWQIDERSQIFVKTLEQVHSKCKELKIILQNILQ